MAIRKRRAIRRPRRVVKRRRVRVPRGLGQGGFTIVRAGFQAAVSCSSAGNIQALGSGGATHRALTFGTPILSFTSGYLARVYDVPFAIDFQMNDVVGVSDLTAIGDAYIIKKVVVSFHGYNTSFVNGNVDYQPCQFIEYIIDRDDATIPTLASFQEKMGTKTIGFNKMGMAKISCSPRLPALLNGSIPTAGYGNQYVDMAYPAATHNGIKGILRNVSLFDVKSLGIKVNFKYTVGVRGLQ